MSNIKAIVFDMDGVLVDAREWHFEALNKALSHFGFEISLNDHLVSFDGLPTKRKLEMLSAEAGLPKGLHTFINELKQQYTQEIIFTHCKPIFHHQYALLRLNQEGYRLAVCSNSIRESVNIMLQKADLNKYLEFSLSNQDVEKPKPDPEIYSNAFRKMGLSPSECLVVEDNENGIKAAKASGANVMVVKDIHEVNYFNIKKFITELK